MMNIEISSIANHLGKAKCFGARWMCCCPAHNDNTPSLSLAWDERTGRFLAKCWAGCPFEVIINALKYRGLLPNRMPHSALFIPKSSKTAKELLDRTEHAIKIWNDSSVENRLLVESYLMARGYDQSIPLTIRQHPRLYHRDLKGYYPAMVAAVSLWPNENIKGVHRTYLCEDGTDKAPIFSNKMMLGNIKGGAVMLSPASSHLVLTEGIETALSIYMATGLPTWATLSTSGMVGIKVPSLEITQEITIAADNDTAGRQASDTLARRLSLEGYKVRIALPPQNMDFNDLLRRPL
jgi:putative DNA primase/helicase